MVRKQPQPSQTGVTPTAVTPDPVTLKVAEASSKDVGRCIARIDPKDLSCLGIQVGDIIQIQAFGSRDGETPGRRDAGTPGLGGGAGEGASGRENDGKKPFSRETKASALAKAMPAFQEDRGKGIIQIDGLVRGNAQVGLDEKVTIHKVSAQPAGRITLLPGEGFLPPAGAGKAAPGDSKYLGRLLEGLPVVAGDTVRATLFGSRWHDFTVASTSPPGPVLVHASTVIVVNAPTDGHAKGKAGAGSSRVTYEDIGGLGREIRRIREMVELPLKYPQVFQRLGIDAPKGVLLYGPPGTGKTLIARAVANETDAYFVHISGPEIMAKYYGESEGKLRAIFEDASAHAPAIVFLDEIDAIAPKREEMGAEKQVERRVVAQLLALMDGLASRGQVLVIGATNIANTLDPALRRPGRFDREIEIGIPDANGRLQIIGVHSRGMPLADDVDLNKLAQITHGFVGADLEALCRESAMACLRTILPNIDFAMADIPYEQLSNLEIRMEHFTEALKEVEPSAIREVFVEIPNVAWSDVGGLDDIKRELVEAVQWPMLHAELFRIAATRPAKGVLLAGPPGTGKTLLVKAMAHESGVNFISVKGPELMSQWVGTSERSVREVFRKARQASPCILFFDEIDSLVPSRGGSGDSGVTQRVVSQFLAELDGIEDLAGVVVVGATNRPDIVDPALLRPGRFDLLLELPMPDRSACLAILKIHTRGKPLDRLVNLESLADTAADLKFTGAELAALCNRAALLAIRQRLEKQDAGTPGRGDTGTKTTGHGNRLAVSRTPADPYADFTITRAHMDEALKLVARQKTQVGRPVGR